MCIYIYIYVHIDVLYLYIYIYIFIFIFIYLYMHTALMLWHLSNRLRYMRWGSGHWVLNLVVPPVGNVSENFRSNSWSDEFGACILVSDAPRPHLLPFPDRIHPGLKFRSTVTLNVPEPCPA